MEGPGGGRRTGAATSRSDRERHLGERLGRRLGVAPARLAELDPDLLSRILRRLEELEAAAAVDELTGALRRRAGEHSADKTAPSNAPPSKARKPTRFRGMERRRPRPRINRLTQGRLSAAWTLPAPTPTKLFS